MVVEKVKRLLVGMSGDGECCLVVGGGDLAMLSRFHVTHVTAQPGGDPCHAYSLASLAACRYPSQVRFIREVPVPSPTPKAPTIMITLGKSYLAVHKARLIKLAHSIQIVVS